MRSSISSRHVLQIADLARGLDHAAHRAADRAGLAAERAGDLDRGIQAGDVGGEGGQHHPGGLLADQPHQAVAHLGLGAGGAGRQDIGRIRDHGQHALPAERLELVDRAVGADQRRRIELPVAGVQDVAERRADGERVRFGDRMGDLDQAAVEAADHEALARRHDVDRHALEVVLLELAPQHRGRERGAEDRAAQAVPEIGDRPEVVLVRMGQDQAVQIATPGRDEARIRQDDVDARQGLVGEADAEVDHQPLPVEAVQVQVQPDLAGAAKRQEHQLLG